MLQRVPVLTYTLIAGCVAFAWQFTGFFPTEASLSPWWWSREAFDAGEWGRLFTSMVAHGGLFHLVFNMIALFFLGPSAELQLGRIRYSAVLLVAGIGGNLAQIAFQDIPVVGASGAIFGLIGLLLMLAPAARMDVIFFLTLPVSVASAIYTALVFLIPQFSSAAPVAHAAHLGGLVAGGAFGFVFDFDRAVKHALWVGAIFAFAFFGVAWFRDADLLSIPRIWDGGGFLGVLEFVWPVLVAVVGIIVSVVFLDQMARRKGEAEV